MSLIDVNKLRRDQAKLKDEMRNICDVALARDDHKMTDDEAKRYQQLESEVKDYDTQIDLAEKRNALEMSDQLPPEGENRTEETLGLGEFLQCVSRSIGGRIDPRLEQRAPTGLNTINPEDGGFLVGTDLEKEIMKKVFEVSNLARKCDRRNISANSNSTSWFEIKEASRAVGSRNGGIRSYFVAEGETVNDSKIQLEKKKIELAKLMALLYVTQEQLDDAPALVSEAMAIIPDEFACTIDDHIFDGPGGALPLGILKSNALIAVPKRQGQKAGTIVYENLVDMRSRLWAKSMAKAEWYINQDCLPQLETMAFVVGNGGVPVYLPAGGASTVPYGTLYGRPVTPIEQCKSCGTLGDIVLADLSQYKLIEKGDLRKDSSMHVRFLNDEQVFRFVKRMNGGPKWSKDITPANGSNTVSPFVALATRS